MRKVDELDKDLQLLVYKGVPFIHYEFNGYYNSGNKRGMGTFRLDTVHTHDDWGNPCQVTFTSGQLKKLLKSFKGKSPKIIVYFPKGFVNRAKFTEILKNDKEHWLNIESVEE